MNTTFDATNDHPVYRSADEVLADFLYEQDVHVCRLCGEQLGSPYITIKDNHGIELPICKICLNHHLSTE